MCVRFRACGVSRQFPHHTVREPNCLPVIPLSGADSVVRRLATRATVRQVRKRSVKQGARQRSVDEIQCHSKNTPHARPQCPVAVHAQLVQLGWDRFSFKFMQTVHWFDSAFIIAPPTIRASAGPQRAMGRADETPQRSKIPSCIFHQSLSQFADAEATDLPANGAKALETPNSARATTSRIDAVFMVHCGATWLFNPRAGRTQDDVDLRQRVCFQYDVATWAFLFTLANLQ